jgi:hypothetical protein
MHSTPFTLPPDGKIKRLPIVSTAGSYLSSNDKRARFGLGADTGAAKIDIRWSSGIRQTLHDVKGDQIFRIEEASEAEASYTN